jgi:signal transduction histidine kinase
VLEFIGLEEDTLKLNVARISIAVLLAEVQDLIEFQCRSKEIEFKIFINKQVYRRESRNDTWTINNDENKLTRVLLNLLNNAYRYTNPGGLIVLHILETEKGDWNFKVVDNGEGMSATVQDQINKSL